MTREEKTKDWCDVLSEMPLEQAQQVVKDVRKKWAEYLEYLGKEPCEQEPCEDAVSRQAVIDAFERFIHELGIEDEPYNYGEMALSVKNVPSVIPQPKTGHWIATSYWYSNYCSNCNYKNDEKTNYCPNCGAKMESEVDNG